MQSALYSFIHFFVLFFIFGSESDAPPSPPPCPDACSQQQGIRAAAAVHHVCGAGHAAQGVGRCLPRRHVLHAEKDRAAGGRAVHQRLQPSQLPRESLAGMRAKH